MKMNFSDIKGLDSLSKCGTVEFRDTLPKKDTVLITPCLNRLWLWKILDIPRIETSLDSILIQNLGKTDDEEMGISVPCEVIEAPHSFIMVIHGKENAIVPCDEFLEFVCVGHHLPNDE